MVNHNSHIINQQAIRQQLISLLGWSLEKYCQFQYQCGLTYLELYLPNDEEGQRMLAAEKFFWNWFKNHWAARDEQFLNEYAYCDKDLVNKGYQYINDPAELVTEIQPSRVVIREAFATVNL
jgi:hypothetical protein